MRTRRSAWCCSKKIEDAKIEYQAAEETKIAAAALAAKEARLSADEWETYREFLEKDYFTKKDFGKLDEFYAHSYDRLSEDGQEEMSKRIHEGIRRDEFKASDLPESVRKRDIKISRDHAGIGTSEPVGHVASVDKGSHAQEGATAMKVLDKTASQNSSLPPNQDLDLGFIDSKGIKLMAAASAPALASIPDASGQRSIQRSQTMVPNTCCKDAPNYRAVRRKTALFPACPAVNT